MSSSGFFSGMAVLINHVSGKGIASNNKITNKRERGTTLVAILITLMIEAIHSSETPVLTRATRRHIPEDGIFRSHCRGNIKSYVGVKILRDLLVLNTP
jgi:hypothetical protein